MKLEFLSRKNLFTDTILYTGSIVLARGLSILIFPILVSNMNETDLVNYDWVLTNIMLAMTLSVFGVDSAVGRLLANNDANIAELRQSSLVIILAQTTITMVILFGYITISNTAITKLDAIIIACLLVCSIITNQITNTAKWLLQRNKVIIIQVSLGILQSLFLYLTYLAEVLNFTTALAAQMLGAAIVACFGLYISNTGFPKLRFSNDVKILFSKSVVLGLNTIIAGSYQALEKNIIYQSVSTSDSSSYLIHFKVALLFSFGLSALQISTVPHLIKILNKHKYRKFFIYNLIIFALVVIALTVFHLISPIFFVFFSKTHDFSSTLMFILLCIQGFIIINTLLETIFIYLEKYTLILAFNGLNILLFLALTMSIGNTSVEQITLLALTALASKMLVMIYFNAQYISIWKENNE